MLYVSATEVRSKFITSELNDFPVKEGPETAHKNLKQAHLMNFKQ